VAAANTLAQFDAAAGGAGAAIALATLLNFDSIDLTLGDNFLIETADSCDDAEIKDCCSLDTNCNSPDDDWPLKIRPTEH